MREGLRWGMCLLVGLAGGYASRVLPAEASAGKVEAEEFVLKKAGKTYGGIGFSGDEWNWWDFGEWGRCECLYYYRR